MTMAIVVSCAAKPDNKPCLSKNGRNYASIRGDQTKGGMCLDAKLKVENVYKIFGAQPKRAMTRARKGQGKDEIFAETGMTVGVNNASE